MKKRSFIACTFFLALCVLLASCGTQNTTFFAEVTAEPLNASGEAVSYRASTLLSTGNSGMMWWYPCTTNNGINIYSYEFKRGTYEICTVSAEGETQTLNVPFTGSVIGMCENNDVLFIINDEYDDAQSTQYSICSFDGDSFAGFPIDLGADCLPMEIRAAGALIFVSISFYNNDNGYTLVAYDMDGQKVYELEVGGSFQMASNGERLYISAQNLKENRIELSYLDSDNRELKPITSFDAGTLLSCRGDKLYFCDGSRTSVFEYDVTADKTTKLFQIADMGISGIGDISVLPYGENDFIACDLETVSLISAQVRGNRTQLVLAINAQAGRYSRAVLDFNENSEEYEVTIKNYSEYPNPQEILGAELAAGNGPDIIDAASFSGDIIRDGVTVDLMQYLNTDPEISTDDFLQGPLNTMLTSDGKLYAIAPYFYVATLFCRADTAVVQPFVGVSDALERLGSTDAAFAGTMSRGTFLTLAFCCGDFESLDREDIAAILEYAASLPETEDYSEEFENIISGRQRFKRITLGSATHIQGMALNSFGETDVANISIWGTPFRGGTGVLIPEMYLAIPEGCANKDAAWEFIKAMLRTDGNLDNEFPLLIANYEKFRQYAQSLIDDGVKMSYITKEGTGAEYIFENLDYFDLSDQLLDGLSALCDVDATIYPIICQCAEPHFEGSITAEAAADNIISRVNLYINEQYG